VVGKVIHVVEPDISEVKRLQKEYLKKEKEADKLMTSKNFSYKDNLLMGPDSLVNSIKSRHLGRKLSNLP
jgi:hypothetical protein